MHASKCAWHVWEQLRSYCSNSSRGAPIWCDRQNSQAAEGFRQCPRHRGDGCAGVEEAIATELAGAADGAIVIETGGAVSWLSHAAARTNATASAFNDSLARSRGPLR
jgi:hypothetical protein